MELTKKLDDNPSDCTYIKNEPECVDSEPLIVGSGPARPSIRSKYNREPIIGLRSYLLALSLATILLVFWLLDSLKDPTFVLLVQGDLKRHQPLAKIFSVVGNITILVLLEIISHEQRKKRRQSVDDRPDLDDAHVLHPRNWHKMSIGMVHHGPNDDSSIPLSIFWVIGTVYITALLLVSSFLFLHPDMRLHPELEGSVDHQNRRDHVGWYFLGYLIYLIIESFGSISVVTLWSFADSNLTIDMAKASYGLLIAIGQIGAIAGSSFATIKGISIPGKFLISCIGILIQMMIMKVYGQLYPDSMREEESSVISIRKKCRSDDENGMEEILRTDDPLANQTENGFRCLDKYMSGVFLILQHNYLLLILGVSCLHEVSLTCLDYEMKLIGLEKYDTAMSFTTFMGRYGQMINILSFLLSYFAFPFLMKRYGVKLTLRIFPSLLIVVNLLTYIAMPENLAVLFMCLSLLKAMTYSINEPTHEILYIPTSNVIKFKAKFWIDIVGARIAKAIGSFINTYAGSVDRVIQYGSLPSIATALVLFVACYAVGIEFESLTESGLADH